MTITKEMNYTMVDVKVGDVIKFNDGDENTVLEILESKTGKSVNLRVTTNNIKSGQATWADGFMRKSTLLFEGRIA